MDRIRHKRQCVLPTVVLSDNDNKHNNDDKHNKHNNDDKHNRSGNDDNDDATGNDNDGSDNDKHNATGNDNDKHNATGNNDHNDASSASGSDTPSGNAMSILDELEPPERPDFRRIGRGVPYVMGTDGKRARYRRSSSAGKILDDEGGLVDWQKRTIVAGAAQRPDLMAVASTLDFDGDKKALRDIVEECLVSGKGTQRATTGTAIHRMLDRVDMGDDWTPAPQFADAVNAYTTAMDAYGLVVVDIECHCIHDTYRLAGTMDRRYRTTRQMIAPTGEMIPIGSVLAADTKTGRSLEYASGSYTTQLAAYASSMRYDVETDERAAFDPPTNQEWGLVIHVSAEDGRCDVYWVDLQAGMEALALADQVRTWRARTDLITPARAPLHAVPTTPVDAPDVPAATDDASAADDAATDVLAAVREWLRERIAAVRAKGDAAVSDLQRFWPAGVDGLKYDTQTEAQLDDIVDALWRVEATHGITFPSSDPRKVAEQHWSDRWAKPYRNEEPTEDEYITFRKALDKHPRRKLIEAWAAHAKLDNDPSITDRYALTHALYEFAMLGSDWADEDVTEMLDGTLRALSFFRGVEDLGHVTNEYAPLIMSSAFAITAGTALLLYDEAGKPVVRNITT